jgi:hypothetical protein
MGGELGEMTEASETPQVIKKLFYVNLAAVILGIGAIILNACALFTLIVFYTDPGNPPLWIYIGIALCSLGLLAVISQAMLRSYRTGVRMGIAVAGLSCFSASIIFALLMMGRVFAYGLSI